MREKQQRIRIDSLNDKYQRLNASNKLRALGYLDGLLAGQEIEEIVGELEPQQLQRVKDFVAGLKSREVS